MTLPEYITKHQITQAQFAKAIGVSEAALSRYVNGSRVPNSIIMRRIHSQTYGKVTANDFFGIAQPTRRAS
jgi:transcriptional regulator with XRE-family HTH domain